MLGHVKMIGNKKHSQISENSSYRFSIVYENKISSLWKINMKFCIFPNHASGDIFPVVNDSMNCKCIGNECLNKSEVVQQHPKTVRIS